MKNEIQILPFPEGKDFAVSFIDDTDLSTRENTQPVYEILNSLNIKGTKTVWVFKQKRTSAFRKKDEKSFISYVGTESTLEDKDYLDFVLGLQKRGFEIALHGVAAGNSYRPEIIEGINIFKSIFGSYPNINIFHEKNIENLYAGNCKLDFWPLKLLEKITDNSDYQGHIQGSPYFWGDVAKGTIKYMRLPFHTISEVNTLKVNPSMPFHDPQRPYVNYWFASSDGSDCQRFNKLLSDANIKKLERENGVCLIYTHFAKGFCYKKNGRYELNREFVNVISNLGRYTNVWCPTASELLDRLLACKNVSIKQTGYEVFVHNKGVDDIDSLTLKVAPDINLTDKSSVAYITNTPSSVIITRLPAGVTVSLKSNRNGNISIERQASPGIYRLERIRIEIMNYYGLLRQNLSGS
jgi:hypothetical protein